MAPIAVAQPPSQNELEVKIKKATQQYKEQAGGAAQYNKKAEEEGVDGFAAASHKNYLPVWDATQHYPPLTPFEHKDRGLDADPTFPEILKEGVEADDITPTIGTEIKGVQLTQLSDKGKDQLALLVAKRKVVVFREQDLGDLPIADALKFGGYFGRHHIHPTSGAPEGYPEIHLVHRGVNDKTANQLLTDRLNTIAWHSDVTYEEQPPSTTFLYILDKPSTGGDTIYANAVEAYNRLSPAFRERLHGLKAVHSGFEQAQAALNRGSVCRRDPVTSVHPIVRTHPATGEKALFVNAQFTRYIVGMKKEESDMILNFLYQHIATGVDFHARIKWEARSVVVWDNRNTCHSAILDWVNGQRRHLARMTPQGERPYETPYDAAKDEAQMARAA